ncbi:hypothetical protein PISL3812_05846 [Talaromyces islandicus]|uniref:rRNA biogenesis protein RRP36 n=1 Tax=Talaromyces islandicus TaxID=28573 RepID=A0A0U1M1G7_TALIS|nr:hypothetical protein PISL3812_05846 [Talaromyces islandicus]
MAISDSLNKRIRARHDEDEDDFVTESSSNEVEEQSDEGTEKSDEDTQMSDNASDDSENDNGKEEDSLSESDGVENEAVQSEMRKISFGALARAQDSLGKRKRSQTDQKKTAEETKSSTLDDIRERLRKAREEKQQQQQASKTSNTHGGNSTKRPTRSSKHAPTVQSSKYQVSRKRIVVEPPNAVKARDPRFDPTVTGTRHNEAATNKAYSFLDEYRSSEIKQLKEQMARTKDPILKDKLKRTITAATDRQRAMDNKRHEREVLSEHKKKERELLREGKKSQPYFLKKSELKREVLKKKYESMGSKERARALERRRKKVASKEKKDLPWARRGMENSTSS